MKIITLTLSPAYDRYCFIKDFIPFGENIAIPKGIYAGGKGINISRALTEYGTENLAVVVIGNENADEFCSMLDTSAMNCRKITVPGRIRENLTIQNEDKGETRISFSGFDAAEVLLNDVYSEIITHLEEETVITLTGRLPGGISMSAVEEFIERLRVHGSKVVIDSRSFTKNDLCRIKPWLIKPNREEISMYLGKKIKNLTDVLDGAKQFFDAEIENVLISLDGEGAILHCPEGIFAAEAAKITSVSTIGAGDSMIAGFISAHVSGFCAEEKLRQAVAFGSAACLTPGTENPEKNDIANLLPKITVRKI